MILRRLINNFLGWSQNQIFGQLRLTYITILTADAKYYRYWVIHFFFHNNIAIDSITKSKRFFIYLTWQLYNEIPLTLALSWKMENNGTGRYLLNAYPATIPGFYIIKAVHLIKLGRTLSINQAYNHLKNVSLSKWLPVNSMYLWMVGKSAVCRKSWQTDFM